MSQGFVSRGFHGRRQQSTLTDRIPPGQYLERGFPVLSAGPTPHTPLAAIAGAPPDPTRPAPGCAFAPRCRYCRPDCRDGAPALQGAGDHQFACRHPLAVATPEAA